VVKEEMIGLVLAEVAFLGVKHYCLKCWGQVKAKLTRKAYLIHYFFHLRPYINLVGTGFGLLPLLAW
jgi:hypothetical protein